MEAAASPEAVVAPGLRAERLHEVLSALNHAEAGMLDPGSSAPLQAQQGYGRMVSCLQSLQTAGVSAFVDAKLADLDEFARHLKAVPFERDQNVTIDLTSDSWVGIILAGTLTLGSVAGSDGDRNLSSGDFLGADTFLLRSPNVSIVACGHDAGLLALLTAQQLEPLLKKCPALAGRLLTSMARSALEHCREQRQQQIALAPAPAHNTILKSSGSGASSFQAQITRAKAAAGFATENAAAVGVWEAVHTPSPISAFCGTVIGLGGLYSLQWWLHTASLSWDIGIPGFVEHDIVTFVGAFGALSALLYGAPAAPLGRPKATMMGFLIVTSLTLSLRYLSVLSSHYLGAGLPLEVEAVLAPALGIAALLYLKQAMHPPAAACAIQFMTMRSESVQDPMFLLAPAAVGVAWMLLVQLLVAKCVRSCAVAPGDKAGPPVSPSGGDRVAQATSDTSTHSNGALARLRGAAKQATALPKGTRELV